MHEFLECELDLHRITCWSKDNYKVLDRAKIHDNPILPVSIVFQQHVLLFISGKTSNWGRGSQLGERHARRTDDLCWQRILVVAGGFLGMIFCDTVDSR